MRSHSAQLAQQFAAVAHDLLRHFHLRGETGSCVVRRMIGVFQRVELVALSTRNLASSSWAG